MPHDDNLQDGVRGQHRTQKLAHDLSSELRSHRRDCFRLLLGFRKPLESELPPAATTAVVIDPETLAAAEKFTREWFDLHSDMPRDQAVEQFMHDAYAWGLTYRVQHGLPSLTVREREALQDKLCARVRCRG